MILICISIDGTWPPSKSTICFTTAELRVISEVDLGHPASADLGANQVSAALDTRVIGIGPSRGGTMPLATRG